MKRRSRQPSGTSIILGSIIFCLAGFWVARILLSKLIPTGPDTSNTWLFPLVCFISLVLLVPRLRAVIISPISLMAFFLSGLSIFAIGGHSGSPLKTYARLSPAWRRYWNATLAAGITGGCLFASGVVSLSANQPGFAVLDLPVSEPANHETYLQAARDYLSFYLLDNVSFGAMDIFTEDDARISYQLSFLAKLSVWIMNLVFAVFVFQSIVDVIRAVNSKTIGAEGEPVQGT
ncbi:MAG: hypothetical protein CMK07_06565 [Ponticaulis sp.]|nr:hypothetical protein [Ponticaulis sp.]